MKIVILKRLHVLLLFVLAAILLAACVGRGPAAPSRRNV
jgi:hypothetical protein